MTGRRLLFGRHVRRLARLDGERFANHLRAPSAAILATTVLPVVLVTSALWGYGRTASLSVAGGYGAATLGMLVAAPIAFLAYGVLMRGSDDLFLRQLGILPEALFLHRSIRLLTAALLVGGAVLVPFAASHESLGRPALIVLPVAWVTAAAATLCYGVAARAMVRTKRHWMGAGMRQFDPELAKAAPLVYAPLAPFLAGTATGAMLGGGAPPALTVLAAAVVSAAGLALGIRAFAGAAPKFAPLAREMAYAPPPEGEGEAFRVGRGLSALLPRRAAAVWVRDAAVSGRRFSWAARVTWPVVLASLATLARWGDSPQGRAWVVAAVGIALLVQSAAVVAMGGVERRGVRWVDRSAGLLWWERFLGRWAWAWGLSLWLLVPVALAWGWWSGVGGAWLWPVAGAATAIGATAVSLLAARRAS